MLLSFKVLFYLFDLDTGGFSFSFRKKKLEKKWNDFEKIWISKLSFQPILVSHPLSFSFFSLLNLKPAVFFTL